MKTKLTEEGEDTLIKECRKKMAARRSTTLFHYTEEEEQRIERAKIGAARFMKNFGLAPERPKINLSRYVNDLKTEWYGKGN